MRFLLHLAALLLIGAPAALAQLPTIPNVTWPRLPAEATAAAGFAPPGWRTETELRGDLNGDGIADLAFTLRAQDRANVIAHSGLGQNPLDSNPRILAIAFGRAAGGYTLAIQDHRLIPRHTDPVLSDAFDPEARNLAIQRGTLRVTLHSFASAGSWGAGNRSFTFRWQEGRFALIGFDSMSVHRGSGATEDVSVNFLTRRMQISTGNIEHDRKRVQWRNLPARPLLSLGQIEDGMEFDPAP
jgi:hypothetical protein